MVNPKNEERSVFVFDGVTVDLKNRFVAAILAYLIPGAGHYYQGRKQKAALFFSCILGLFVLGFAIGNGRVVYAYPETFDLTGIPRFLMRFFIPSKATPATNGDVRIHAYAQALVGIPAFPMIYQSKVGPKPIGQQPLWGFMAPPPTDGLPEGDRLNPDWLSKWNADGSASFDLGSLYTAVAGLLNLLVIFDAFSGPMPIPVSPARNRARR